jgi:pimeloyl-ACP methyl ester carboxylesterase
MVRSAVLDGVYPPQINGEQNEPEIVRGVFERLYADCAADKLCRERHPALADDVRAVLTEAERTSLELVLALEDGPQSVRLDGAKLLLVLLHMMRQGEAALVPEAVAALRRGDNRIVKQFAEDLEEDDGGLLETNAQQFGGLFNTIECRETWAVVDQKARERAIRTGGLFGLTAQLSKLPAFCPAWRVPVAPAGERQPVSEPVPTLLMSGGYDWLTPAAWGNDAAVHLPVSRHVIFRSQGHGVSSQDQCAARLRDEFFDAPDPRYWALPCRSDEPPDFAGAAERVKALSSRTGEKSQ